MGIRIEWYDRNQHIITHIYEGEWTVNDYYALIDENYKLIDSVNDRVDIINDLRATSTVPKGMVAPVKYAIRKAHPNEGINVLVGATSFIKALLNSINEGSGQAFTEVHFASTIEDAVRIIMEVRAQQSES